MNFLKGAAGTVLVAGLLLSAPASWANQLTISNVTLTEPNTTLRTIKVEFDISWTDSWRTNTNYDAVWLFMKYSTNSGSTWAHGTLKYSGTNPSGFSGGSGTDLDIIVPSDLKGAFLQRADKGIGSISNTDVQLVWDFSADGLTSATTAMVRVYGLEMVYVPTASYILGDALPSTSSGMSGGSLYTGISTPRSGPISTTLLADWHAISAVGNWGGDDATLTDTASGTGIGIDGDGGLDTNDDGTIDNADFPTGYNAFYAMKYEITQVQYRDFLNTLTTAMHVNRTATTAASSFTLTASSGVTSRQGIRNPSGTFGTGNLFTCDVTSTAPRDFASDGHHIACNFLGWPDIAAMADWAALRPMTELEFEKAGKTTSLLTLGSTATGSGGGTFAVLPYMLAFGYTDAIEATSGTPTLTSSGLVSEYLTFGNVNYSALGTTGPVRVGAFAYHGTSFGSAATATRLKAGTSTYGLYELSGNVAERVVTIGNSTGRAFRGSHGDGRLTTVSTYEGNATNTDWPGLDATTARGVTGSTGHMLRGGSFADSFAASGVSSRLSIADRGDANWASGRLRQTGGRLARTA